MSDPVEAHVAGLLQALGVGDCADVQGTPARVAELWRDNLLAGYQIDPTSVFGEPIADPSGVRVTVSGLPFHMVCPHHLTPGFGHVDLMYQPGGQIVGFGALERLVFALSRRLVLQETLTAQLADGLMAGLGAAGAACRITATHLCLTLQGREPRGAQVITSVGRGCLAHVEGLFGAPE